MTSVLPVDAEPVVPAAHERELLVDLERALGGDKPVRLDVGTESGVELPRSVRLLLKRAVQELAEGNAVAVFAVHVDVTTQEAANLLNVSRPYVVRLIDQGDLPCTRTVGGHRRLRLADVLAYKRIRDADRRAALDEMSAEAERLGLEY